MSPQILPLLWPLRRVLVLALAGVVFAACAGQGFAASVVTGRVECVGDLSPDDRLHCENVLLDAADVELNRIYEAALAALDPQGALLLRSAQRAWVAYRDMNFEAFAAADPDQGQAGLADRVRDLRQLTKGRSAELQTLALLAAGGKKPGAARPPSDSAARGAETGRPADSLGDSAAIVPPVTPDDMTDDGPAVVPEQPLPEQPLPEVPVPPIFNSPPDMNPDGPPPGPDAPPVPGPLPPSVPEVPDAPASLRPPPAAIGGKEELERLLGRHSLRLQWLSSVPSGTAEIVERDGGLWLSGQQGEGLNMLLVEGRIASVQEDGFAIQGRVVTRVGFLGGGQPCVREGELWFVRKSGRPFWRLQSIGSPCTGVSDYIDITVDREP